MKVKDINAGQTYTIISNRPSNDLRWAYKFVVFEASEDGEIQGPGIDWEGKYIEETHTLWAYDESINILRIPTLNELEYYNEKLNTHMNRVSIYNELDSIISLLDENIKKLQK